MGEDIVIDCNSICNRVTLLRRKSYRNLEYSWYEDNIFCASVEYEDNLTEIENEEVEATVIWSQSSSDPACRISRISQDY